MASGVVGIKPTVGLTSRNGVIPISETQDSVGTYGRTVADAARALDVIAAEDPEDDFTLQPGRRQPTSYCDSLKDRHALKGARFGLPMKRFWEVAPPPQRQVAERVFKLLEDAGVEIVHVEMPCAEERLASDGEWDWEKYGDTQPEISEITVSKVQTYYLMNRYLSKLSNTTMKTLEDIIRYNDENRGTEGGHAGDLPAWPDGQELFRECIKTKGVKDKTYYAALKHIQTQSRENGIDAALRYSPNPASTAEEANGRQLDSLLFCDVKGGGIQIAAQAGYPIISIPIGLDPDGMPVALTLQHTAWQEDKLVKWASAIEDLLMAHNEQQEEQRLGRVPPRYMKHMSKNIPLEHEYRYPKGA
jgi:amidase